jgi:hypothetical protein
MKIRMLIRESGQKTIVIFKGGTGVRSKMMFFIQMLAFCFAGGIVLYAAIAGFQKDKIALSLLGLAVAGGLVYMCWRIMARITGKEQLSITGQSLTVITTSNGRATSKTYPVDEIQNLCYIGSGATGEHLLKSENLDALGFGVRQHFVDAVTAEGNVIFYHDARQVRFGIGLSSWNAEKLNQLLIDKTAGVLSMAGLPEEIPESVWNR